MSATILQFRLMVEAPNRIRELREAAGWSQGQLAATIAAFNDGDRCEPIQISHLERGVSELNLKWMRRIARALDVTPGEILSRDDNPQITEGDERDLLERYRSADKQQKTQIQEISSVIAPDKPQKRAANDEQSLSIA